MSKITGQQNAMSGEYVAATEQPGEKNAKVSGWLEIYKLLYKGVEMQTADGKSKLHEAIQ